MNFSDESDIEDQVSLNSVEQANKTRKARKKRVNFEPGDGAGAAAKQAKKRGTGKQGGGRSKQRAKDNLDLCLNRVKTKNKLIGDIEDNDLYGNDEDCLDGFGSRFNRPGDLDDEEERQMYQGKDIEIDFKIPTKNKPEANNNVKGFLDKMKHKKMQQEQAQGVEQEIVSYGFVQALANKVSANQLAASGIQLSMRQKLIRFIGEMDKQKMTNKEHELLDALKRSSQGTLKEDKDAKADQEVKPVADPSVSLPDAPIATEPKASPT